VAALHPSAQEVSRPSVLAAPRLITSQLALLSFASMIAPAVLLLQVARGGVTDGVAIAVGSAALFSLVVTRMAQLLREIEKQARYVRELARQDELTGLPNRRAWNDELPRALERSRRDGAPVCVAILDLDLFKRFNDKYGRPAGDRLLKEAAAAWDAQLRAVDMLARFGGEEFVALLPGAEPAVATSILARMQESTPLGQSFSGGVACWDGDESCDELIARADAALYVAKAAGRNQFAVSAGPRALAS
jgi:diguanylate cyclase (GGDEF)-like protein